MKKTISMVLVFVMMVSVLMTSNVQVTLASNKYITVNEFIVSLLKELKLEVKSSNSNIKKLKTIRVIKDGDFNNYNDYLTRGNALMMLSRADDYLNKTKISDEQVQIVIEKRISDIDKAKESKREDIAKGFIKGFMKGYSNGSYVSNRTLKINTKITRSGALSSIKMITDSSLRALISPDGQVIRDNYLPTNADKYEYILESFPNEFYEKPFIFEGKMVLKQVNVEDYSSYPKDIKDYIYRSQYGDVPMSKEMDKYLYDWTKLAEDYIHTIFNVDHKTIDKEWIEAVNKFYTLPNTGPKSPTVTTYIPKVKDNKVIVETSYVIGEPSTFYRSSNVFYIRVYVKYRITAENTNVNHNDFLYSWLKPNLDNFVNGEWREGIFDVGILYGKSYNGGSIQPFYISPLTTFEDSIIEPLVIY